MEGSAKRRMLFVGGLDAAHAFKGLSLLLDTLVLVQEYDLHLVVVGDGNLKKTYRAQVHDKGLESRITFAGNVSQEDLPRYYRLAIHHLSAQASARHQNRPLHPSSPA